MKTAVVYRSHSGFTKVYAKWIAEELSADLFDARKVKIGSLAPYDAIVYGGGLYVGGINGVKLITQNLGQLQGKKLAVFATGATPNRKEDIQHVLGKNFTEQQLQSLKFFYLRGGFNFRKLPPSQKALMLLLKLKIWLKKNKTADEKGMYEAFAKPMDFTRKKNITELVKYIKS